MLSKEEVLKIAKLARLELTENEVEKMQKDLSAILDYFELLKKIPNSKLQITNKSETQNSNLRKDEAMPQEIDVVETLIQSAPDKKDGYIKVKSIL